MSTPFSDWLRSLVGPLSGKFFSAHNLDYIWHNYRENWFITIEEKKYGGKPSPAQRDTHGIVAQLLKLSSGEEVVSSFRKRSVSVEYRGHYYVSFERTNPDDSSCVFINDKLYANANEAIRHLLYYGSCDSLNTK